MKSKGGTEEPNEGSGGDRYEQDSLRSVDEALRKQLHSFELAERRITSTPDGMTAGH